MFLIIVVIIVILISLVAVIAAVVISINNKKAIKQIPVITTNARILRTYDRINFTNDNFSTNGTVDSFNAWENKSYFVDFIIDNGERKTLEVNKKTFVKLIQGNSGVLKYRGDELISFDYEEEYNPEIQHKLFFIKENKSGNTIKFYASAPSIGVEIESNEAITCDYDEISRFVDKIYHNEEENFFVLEDKEGNVIQFFNDGKSEVVILDIPAPEKKGSYVREFSNLNELKYCIKLFFDGEDIFYKYDLSFSEW